MDYFKEVNLAVTICDKEGKILEMNDKIGRASCRERV
mgnify:CR=1 FL=1